jgi:hypothetical protein
MAATGRKGDATVLLRKALQGKLPDEAQAEARKLLEQLSK